MESGPGSPAKYPLSSSVVLHLEHEAHQALLIGLFEIEKVGADFTAIRRQPIRSAHPDDLCLQANRPSAVVQREAQLEYLVLDRPGVIRLVRDREHGAQAGGAQVLDEQARDPLGSILAANGRLFGLG